MMVDQLVMLLSTDWFKPYWNSIGLDINENAKASIQQGCRQILGQILSGVENYYHTSFSEERLAQTRLMLESLVTGSVPETRVLAVIEEWTKLSHEGQKAAWICSSLTGEALLGQISEEDLRLGPAITSIMVGALAKYDLESFEFVEICEASETSWDRYTRGLTPELPTTLADTLGSVLTSWRFEAFWNSVRGKLAPTQRNELIAWYRRMAKARSRRDLIPAYVN
jgi:hypothetical protein